MDRRTYLGLSSGLLAPSLAGCSNMGPLGDDKPDTYSQDEEDSLLFEEAQDDWPDDLQRDDSINENYDRGFVNQDQTIVLLMHVDTHEDIETAKDEMEQSRSKASNDEDYPLADDAFIADDGSAANVIFRHMNARGQTLAVSLSGGEVVPDRNRASTYADLLFEQWQK